MKEIITTTDALNYTIEVYIREGWITPQEVKRISGSSLIIAFGVVLLALLPAVLVFFIGL
jgi:choline-glycine betaine transporter